MKNNSSFKGILYFVSGLLLGASTFLLMTSAYTIQTNLDNALQVIKEIIISSDGSTDVSKQVAHINMDGTGKTYFKGNVGIGTTGPIAKLDVAGAIRIGKSVGNNAGTIIYSGTNFYGYNGTAWFSLGIGGVMTTAQANSTYVSIGSLSNYYTISQSNARYYTTGYLNGKFYTTGQINTTLSNYSTISQMNTLLNSYYSISQMTTILNGYYTTGQVKNLLNNYYTKTGLYTQSQSDSRYYMSGALNALLVSNYYPKTSLYTRTESDARFYMTGVLNTLLANSYYTKTNLYIKAEVDAKFYTTGVSNLKYVKSGFVNTLSGRYLPAYSGTKLVNSNIVFSGGNIGIANKSPKYKLDVTGTGRFSNGLIVGGILVLSGSYQSGSQISPKTSFVRYTEPASPITFLILNGTKVGQVLIIKCDSLSNNNATLQDSSTNPRLTASRVCSSTNKDDTLSLIRNGTYRMETSRSNN